MSFDDGWAAMNRQTPPRVPRTEYSATMHWDLMNAVLGTAVGPDSSNEEKQRVVSRFVKAWNYYFMGNHIPPNTPVESAIFYNEVYQELSFR